MKLSVVIPAYNEINTIQTIITKVQRVDLEKEIIVIDDFSRDGTREFLLDLVGADSSEPLDHLSEMYQQSDIKVIFQDKNQGKGAALNCGIKYIEGDVVVFQDADLEYDPEDYHKLLQPILDGYADVVYGSRYKGGSPHRILFFWHSIGNKLLTFFSNMLSNLNLSDMETCYKMIKREFIDQIDIQERGFGIEPEITAKLARSGARIYEVGISYYGRTYREGKKISWKDAVRAVYCILRYNLFTLPN